MKKYLIKTNAFDIILLTDVEELTDDVFQSMLYSIETFSQIDRSHYGKPVRVSDDYQDGNSLLVTVTKSEVNHYNKHHS